MNKRQIKVLGVIPARGGSKSITHKNIVLVAGKPLIYYTIREAKESKLLDAVIVSTDDPKIAAVAKKYGADVPFLRPEKISGDKSKDIEFMRHALSWLKKNRGWEPEILVNLRPTSPLRTAEDIDKVIALAIKDKCSIVKTVSLPSPHNPFKMWLFDGNKTSMQPILPTKYYKTLGTDVPRQILPLAYWQNGLVDAIRVKNIKTGKIFAGPIGGVITDSEKSIDLDEPKDIKTLEEFLTKQSNLHR
ncbi:MAG: N-acylneuraminate cytidylyltransferase [Parcubacteria group bacterium Gr01-1014_3]|nr:MAG: N-acylneuraminate cytidylyltransferase [Parcubacteria group bacterium Gr01-1014_3]